MAACCDEIHWLLALKGYWCKQSGVYILLTCLSHLAIILISDLAADKMLYQTCKWVSLPLRWCCPTGRCFDLQQVQREPTAEPSFVSLYKAWTGNRRCTKMSPMPSSLASRQTPTCKTITVWTHVICTSIAAGQEVREDWLGLHAHKYQIVQAERNLTGCFTGLCIAQHAMRYNMVFQSTRLVVWWSQHM